MQKSGEYTHYAPEVPIDRKEIIIDGRSSLVTILRPSPQSAIDIVYDQDLVNTGIVTEPQGLLIDQKATAELLDRPAGHLPQDYLTGRGDAIGLMGGHFGWQREAFIIEDGCPIIIKNDRDRLTGRFPTLLRRDGAWAVEDVYMRNGKPFGGSLQQLTGATGFNGAQIVKGGEPVRIEDISSDSRIIADARAVVDFSDGVAVDGSFFQNVRKLPITSQKLRNLAKGALTTFRLDMESISPELAATDNELRGQVAGIPAYRTHHGSHGTIYAITDKLPEQKVPLIGYGADSQGNLIIVAVDGRQKESAGVSIRELASLMVSEGVVDGILGAGGGDVAIIEQEAEQTRLINSPSNINQETGTRVARKMPNMIILSQK